MGAVLFFCVLQLGQIQYAVTDLGENVYPQAINDYGQIAGYHSSASGFTEPFFYNRNYFNWHVTGGVYGILSSVNNSGVVAGRYDVLGNSHAFTYSDATGLQDLGTFGKTQSGAIAVNDFGQVVGYYGNSSPWRAFSLSNGTMKDLGTLGGSTAIATDVNNNGVVTGRSTNSGGTNYGFVYYGTGTMQSLGTVNSFYNPKINNVGQISGTSAYDTAFLYTPGTGRKYINFNGQCTYATNLNDKGQVVGFTEMPDGYNHAIIYSGTVTRDLNALTATAGWRLEYASSISNNGQIVGYGYDLANKVHGFLLSPVSNVSVVTTLPSSLDDAVAKNNALKKKSPATSLPSGQLKRWNGSSWQTITAWDSSGVLISQPTVVVTHGWKTDNSDFFAQNGLLSNMAQAFFTQNPLANILAWDWQAQAVSQPGQTIVSAYDDIAQEGLRGSAASAREGAHQGILLARELQNLGINNSALQLVGHSNGGAVAGKCASVLAENGLPVARVATLDTPNLSLYEIPQAVLKPDFKQWGMTSVNALQYVQPSSALQVENYYSNGLLGRAAFGFGAPLQGTNVFNGRIYPGNIVATAEDAQNCDHLRIASWYCDFLATNTPWTAGNFTEQGYNTKIFGLDTVSEQNIKALRKISSETFEDATNWLGQHAQIFMRDAGNFCAKIASGSDGYLFKDVSIPNDAYFLTFDLKIENPVAGDFLTLSLGDQILFYKSLNAGDSDFSTINPIYVGDFAGQDAILLFTLNHDGVGNSSVLIDNIEFSAIPEPSSFYLLISCAIFLVALFLFTPSFDGASPAGLSYPQV